MRDTISVMIGGFQKTASSALFRAISSHRDVYGHAQKEMTYFYRECEWEAGWESAAALYFPDAAARQGQVFLGKHVLFCLSRPSMERLKAHNPSAKVVLSLRDPVDRAYSAYWYNRRLGREKAKSFNEAVEREFADTSPDVVSAYLHAGHYVDHIAAVEEMFGADNMYLVSSKSMDSGFTDVVAGVLGWMGLEPTEEAVVRRVVNQAAIPRSEFLPRILHTISQNKRIKSALTKVIPANRIHKVRDRLLSLNEKPGTYEPLAPAMRSRLDEYFEPYNARLHDRYGITP